VYTTSLFSLVSDEIESGVRVEGHRMIFTIYEYDENNLPVRDFFFCFSFSRASIIPFQPYLSGCFPATTQNARAACRSFSFCFPIIIRCELNPCGVLGFGYWRKGDCYFFSSFVRLGMNWTENFVSCVCLIPHPFVSSLLSLCVYV